VQNFVVLRIPEGCADKANFLVENTLAALQHFAAYYRSLFSRNGLTGSNGKTIVKEWLNFLLSPDFNVIRSPKSYNSQVGVPLSIFAINEKHNMGFLKQEFLNEMENWKRSFVLP
jgi:alanine racemase